MVQLLEVSNSSYLNGGGWGEAGGEGGRVNEFFKCTWKGVGGEGEQSK